MNTASPMMDRRLKERLVGATILVALIVLIVPELLSGPKRPSVLPLAAGLPTTTTRSVWVDLPTGKTVSPPQSDAAPESQRTAPSTASPNAASAAAADDAGGRAVGGSEGATAPGVATSPGAGEPAPASAPTVATLKAQIPPAASLETPPSAPKSTPGTNHPPATVPPRHAWAVQLGSFESKANAERLVHQLQATGGSAGSFYIVPGGSGGSLRYRVRMGPLTDRSAAERAAGKLKAQGRPATVVTPAA